MSSETDDDDVYVARLREVFNDCCDDGQQQQQCGDARLGRDGLLLLCERLQLQEQAGNLLERCTAGRTDGKVDFENFKEAFVLVLSQTVDSTGTSTGVSTPAEGGPDGTTDDESSIEDEIVPVEVSPKFVKGCKKYGRRSRPEGPMHTESQSEDEQHNVEEKRHWLDTRSSAGSLIGLSPRGFPTPIASPQPLLRTVTPSSEMFEASGQLNGLPLNQHTATALPGSQATAEVSADIAQQLEAVWNEVDAQQKGYLSREELGCMCQHVGMESLSEEELDQLFLKLDTNRDERISFDDFLRGFLFLQQESASPDGGVAVVGGRACVEAVASNNSGIFSVLDPESTGFAKHDEIVDFWESLGVKNADVVLKGLLPASGRKVSLQELSLSLQREMAGSGGQQSPRLCAASASYVAELKHVRSTVEQLNAENDKLRLDVLEANTRVTLLAEEVDDTHALLEHSNQSKLASLERRYQHRLKSVQSQLVSERDCLSTETDQYRQQLQEEVESSRAEEGRIRERFSSLQKENAHLVADCVDMGEQLEDVRKQNQQLSRELVNIARLKEKIAELEQAQELLLEAQEELSTDRLQRLEEENKELRDSVDVAAAENEALRQQLATVSKRRKFSRGHGGAATRHGSTLSDYVKPHLRMQVASTTSTDENDEDPSPRRVRPRRRPLHAKRVSDPRKEGEDTRAATEHRQEVALLQAKIDEQERHLQALMNDTREFDMLSQRDDEREQLIGQFEAEKRHLVSEHAEEMARRIRHSEQEKAQLIGQLEEERQESSIRLEADLDGALEIQRIDLQASLEQAFAEELEAMRLQHQGELARLDEAHRGECDAAAAAARREVTTVAEARALEQQREATARADRDHQEALQQSLEQQLALKLAEEEAELRVDTLQGALAAERAALQREREERDEVIARMLAGGAPALCGKLKEDFQALLRAETEAVAARWAEERGREAEEERRKLQASCEEEAARMREELNAERSRLDEEKVREEQERAQLQELRKQLDEERLHQEKAREQFEAEKVQQEEQRKQMEAERMRQQEEEKKQWEEDRKLMKEERRQREEERKWWEEERKQQEKDKQQREEERKLVEEVVQREREWTQREEARQRELASLREECERLQLAGSINQSLAEQYEEDEVKLIRQQLQEANEKLHNHMTSHPNGQLQQQCAELQQVNSSIAAASEQCFADAKNYITKLQCDHRQQLQEAGVDQRRLQDSLQHTHDLLDEYIDKYKTQLAASGRRDKLVKELYVENAELVGALQAAEAGQKQARDDARRLDDKCQRMQRMLGDVCNVAIL